MIEKKLLYVYIPGACYVFGRESWRGASRGVEAHNAVVLSSKWDGGVRDTV